jgi:hypothetical protein
MQANIKLAQPREWQPPRRARSLSVQIKQQLKIENLFTIAHHGTFPGGDHHRNRRSTIGRISQLFVLDIYTLPIPGHLRNAVENLSRLVTNGDEFRQIAEGGPTTIQ